jgi:hypothetical protein
VSTAGLTVEPQVLAVVQERFRWHSPYLERIQGARKGVRRRPVGPPWPLEFAALALAEGQGGPPLT